MDENKTEAIPAISRDVNLLVRLCAAVCDIPTLSNSNKRRVVVVLAEELAKIAKEAK